MSWKSYFDENIISPKEAIEMIDEGAGVVISPAAGEPHALTRALNEYADSLKNVKVMQLLTTGDGTYVGDENDIDFETCFIGQPVRKAVNEGKADFIPVFFHQLPEMIQKDAIKCDVALVSATPPDEEGYVSFGTACDYTVAAVRKAKFVIAQINDRMPYTFGENRVHVSEINKFVLFSEPIFESFVPELGENDKQIGKYCAQLIDDGATLQLGIGAIPNAVLAQLGNKKDLGIHSELISDGVVELAKSGVVNGSKKSFKPGKMVATFLMGTQKLYDFVDGNPDIEMREVNHCNDPREIANNYQMICINSCIKADLLGQVVSDAIGCRQFSGVGGQVDFLRGAAMAKDGLGKGIIAMESTLEKNGKLISKIVPCLDSGDIVTTSRQDVDYLVTEYGIAELKWKTVKERAEAIVNVAHPDFRQWLKDEFEKQIMCK